MTDNIDVGQLSEAINDKMDRDANNAEDALRADYVIDYQAPTAENNYTWYRLYKSGWVEQGGRINHTSSDISTTITFLKEMEDTNYSFVRSPKFVANANCFPSYSVGCSGTMTTTGVTVYIEDNGVVLFSMWEVKGMSAQGGNQ